MPRAGSRFLSRPGGASLAFFRMEGKSPGLMFLGGFRSDMSGTKASALEARCRRAGRAYVRFDYGGHGESSGAFEEGTIGAWAEDAVAVLDEVARGPQVLVGSSMGGWIMLLAALARPDRVRGLVGVAAAPDFTEDLIRSRLDDAARAELAERGFFMRASDYEPPYPITRSLLDEGANHLLLRGGIGLTQPVRLIHGMRDESVPWETSLRLANALEGGDARLTLIKDGDHRLSRPRDLALIARTAEALAEEAGA